ncbi:MAG: hypothetical protein OEM28_01680 [Nitrosopumilus sp.]|nr:hypothetical protein [Nitrosopumilus sp.]MDH3487788.1 hypothetical protein [Nitrosopumilus sp.]
MIEGIEIEQILKTFNENTWTLFAVTVSILVLTVYEMTAHPLWKWIQRPKIKIIPNTHIDTTKDKINIRFSITVKNTGKSLAKDCSISARYTGMNEKPFHKIPLPKCMFPLDWINGNEKRRTMDLFTKYSEGYAELPLESYVGLDGMSFGMQSTIKKEWDEGYSNEDILIDDKKGNRYYNLRVVFHIRYNSKVEEKHFLIKIKTQPVPITKDDVIFTSLDTH